MVMSEGVEEKSGPELWSAKAKTDVIFRLFRGESVDEVSREIQVPVHEIETWRKDFPESGQAGLKRKSGDPEERAFKQTQAKVGELTMKLELAGDAARKNGVRRRADEVEVAGLVSVGRGRRHLVRVPIHARLSNARGSTGGNW